MKKSKNFKRLLVLLITIVAIALSVLVAYATQSEEPESNITTFFHESTGTLIVSGTGEIRDLYPREYADGGDPIYGGAISSSDETVRHIIIDEGITSISDSFNDMKSLQTITFPQTLEKIHYSFMECPQIKSLDFPKSLTDITYSSFNDCTGLENIQFSNKINIVCGNYGNVFARCTSLKYLYIPGGSTLKGAFAGGGSLEKVVLGLPDVTLIPGYSCCEFDSVSSNFSGSENLVIVTAEGNSVYDEDSYFDPVYDEESSFDVAELPVLPEKITAKSDGYGFNVDWDCLAMVDTYHLYRRTKGNTTWDLIADVKTSKYYDNTVESGKQYAYLVKTDDNSGYTATSWCEFIATPKLVSATNTVKGIKVTWEKVDGAVKYRLYRIRTGTYMDEVGDYFDYEWEKVADVTGTSCVDTKVFGGGEWRYTVRAYGKTVSSGVIKPGLECMFITAPKIKSVTNTSEGIKITWNTPDSVQCYYIYRREPGGAWKRINRIPYAEQNTFIDENAESGKTYEYTIRANVYGEWTSGYYSGKAIVCLDTPGLSSATSTRNGVVLKWGTVEGAKGYRIYRKTGNSSWELIKIAEGGSVASYTDKAAKKGTTYTYTVRAYNGKTYSDFDRTGISVKDKY